MAPAAEVRRLLSADLGAALESFAHPDLLAAGKVNVIALDAIAERFGSRWPLRQDPVHAHAEAALSRNLGRDGFHLRISATDYLICHPHLDRIAGQAACLSYLREILTHFLGESASAELGVHQVTAVSPEGVQAVRMDPASVRAADRALAEGGLPEPTRSSGAVLPEPPPGGVVDRWTPFVASSGQRIHVTARLEPIYELKGLGRIGFRVARRVVDARSGRELTSHEEGKLSRLDLLRIDMATIARGLERLKASGDEAQLPSLIVPVSFVSVSHGDSRARIVAAFQDAAHFVQRGVICELTGIESVPPSVLMSAVAAIRPHVLLTIGFVRETACSLAGFHGSGLQGLSLESLDGSDEARFAAWAKRMVVQARAAAKSVLVYRARSERHAAIAQVLGATHAGLHADECEPPHAAGGRP